MGQIEITVFENTSALDEQAISIAVLGKVSIRQLIIIFSGLLLAVGIFQTTASLMFAVIPALIGVILGLPRPKILSMDRLVYSILRFFIKGTSSLHHHTVSSSSKGKKSSKNKTKKPKSQFLKIPGTKIIKIKKDEKFREIFAKDLTKLRRLNIKIIDPSGEPLPRTFVKIYLDGMLINSLSTDSDGMVEAAFIPKKEGQMKLKITCDKFDEPVLDETILIKTS